ncbi:MAG TPA: hypothetical protein VI548_10565, partial [Chitinophagaceae bacterium]|nr:hypothetical protein [Chitinophagaceae bacterium]
SNREFFSSLDVINKIMTLEKLQMINGQLTIKARNNTEIILQNTSLLLNSREVVKSPTVTSVEKSVEELKFSKGVLKLKDLLVKMENAYFDGKKNRLLFEKLNLYNPDQRFNVSTKNTLLGNVQFDDSLNIISADTVSWGQARIEINNLSKETRKGTSALAIMLKMLNGNNTVVDINNENSSLSFTLNSISANTFSKKEKLHAEKLTTIGKDFYYYTAGTEITAANFSINDLSPSAVNSILIKQNRGANSIFANIPEATFTPDINSIVSENTEIKNLRLLYPELTISTKEKVTTKELKSFPEIKIDQLEIIGPVFKIENSHSKKLPVLSWDGRKNKLMATNIQSEKATGKVSISSLDAAFSDFSFTGSVGKTTKSKEVQINTRFENLVLQNGEKINWSVKLKELVAKNYSADSFNKKPAQVKIYSGKLEDLTVNSENLSSFPELIKENPSFSVSNISGFFMDEKKSISWQNLVYHKAAKTISLDTITYLPVMSRDAFIAAHPFQTDYMTFRSGKILATDFDLDRYLDDSTLRLGDLNIANPFFTSYRDKRPPFKSGIIKPLPTKLIQKIPFSISIDTLKIENGTTVYTELNDKNNETGLIPVTRMSGDIFPIKNFDLTGKDSLRIRLNGYLLDSAWIRLRTRESYLDSLSGFLITLRMRPRSLLYLNEVLEPLASVNLQSGYLDTLLMRAVATEYLSLGEMRMFYRDLKVKFHRNSYEEKKRFLTGLMTFIANNFVIKNDNKKRVGVVYFPRIRDRSFINYYIKIAMSGMASSVGAKKNKRLLRKYKKQLKIRQLPPIDFD